MSTLPNDTLFTACEHQLLVRDVCAEHWLFLRMMELDLLTNVYRNSFYV